MKKLSGKMFKINTGRLNKYLKERMQEYVDSEIDAQKSAISPSTEVTPPLPPETPSVPEVPEVTPASDINTTPQTEPVITPPTAMGQF